MKLIIDIDDEDIEALIRHAFMVQDKDATDEQLVDAVRGYLVSTAVHVAAAEERQAANDKAAATLRAAGVQSIREGA